MALPDCGGKSGVGSRINIESNLGKSSILTIGFAAIFCFFRKKKTFLKNSFGFSSSTPVFASESHFLSRSVRNVKILLYNYNYNFEGFFNHMIEQIKLL